MDDTSDPHGLAAFFSPRSIAVIGASPDPKNIRGRLFGMFAKHRFPGRLYPVNPSYSEINGIKAYGSIAEIPEAVDLALIAVPANAVLNVVAQCAASDVKHAVIYSSGFAEEGAEGRTRQDQLVAAARRGGMRLSGPNAQGFFNLRDSVAATFSPAVDPEEGLRNVDIGAVTGGVGVVAHSGGLGFALFIRGIAKQLGFNYVVSCGNEADLTCLDFATFILEQSDTRVLLMFLEGLREPRRFTALAERAAELGKPIIVAKVGRSSAAQRAAVSHTGSLTGSDTAYNAAFRRYGVIRADDLDEMLEMAAALVHCRLPAGNRVGIVTTSGGSGAWLADACDASGLRVPELEPSIQKRIRAFLPPYGAAQNPVDITAQTAFTGGLSQAIAALSTSEAVDLIAVAAPLANRKHLPFDEGELSQAVRQSSKPVAFYTFTPPSDRSKAVLAQIGLYCSTDLRSCGKALRALADYAQFQRERRDRTNLEGAMTGLRAEHAVSEVLRGADAVLCEYEAKVLLRSAGLDVPDERLARTETEAVAAARELGFPVALKVQSPQLPHKSDAGALALSLGDEEAVRRAYARIQQRAREAAPDADVRGVLVQPQLPVGLECVAGVTVDPDFGPLVMFGLGGVFVEALHDVVFALAPLDRVDAFSMMATLRTAKLLDGIRGRPPADKNALADLLVKLSQLAIALQDDIAEIDLNPVFVYPAGEGLQVVDALMTKRS